MTRPSADTLLRATMTLIGGAIFAWRGTSEPAGHRARWHTVATDSREGPDTRQAGEENADAASDGCETKRSPAS